MTNPNNLHPHQPWYKNTMVWFAFSPAIIGVCVGLTLLTIGTITFDGTVHENYYKEGRAINQSFDQDRLAMAKNIKAVLVFAGQELQLELKGDFDQHPAELLVLMENPTRSKLDFAIPVKHLANGHYLGQLPKAVNYDWDVKIFGPEKDWRIYGRGYFPLSQPLELRPSER